MAWKRLRDSPDWFVLNYSVHSHAHLDRSQRWAAEQYWGAHAFKTGTYLDLQAEDPQKILDISIRYIKQNINKRSSMENRNPKLVKKDGKIFSRGNNRSINYQAKKYILGLLWCIFITWNLTTIIVLHRLTQIITRSRRYEASNLIRLLNLATHDSVLS